MSNERLPRVAILGRPNVGKSTLFNRLLGRREAIVGKFPGLTRDRHRAATSWEGRHFELVDTGGLEWNSEDELLRRIQDQAMVAVEEAAVVLLVVDCRDGLIPVEEELARELRRRQMRVILVANKCDSEDLDLAASEFHALGIEPVLPVSAEHGRGIGTLLDAIVAGLPDAPRREPELPEGTVRVAVVGRPNVGKSSLVNALLGVQRIIVSEVAGTTRDPIDVLIERDGSSYLLVDTAGMRRGGKRQGFAEHVSVVVARKRMRRAHVALLVIDATVGLGHQDMEIAAEADSMGCGLILVVNKWDLIDVDEAPILEWVDELKRRLGRLGYALVAFTSAREGTGVTDLLPLVDRVRTNHLRRIPTAELNATFEALLRRRAPQGGPGMPQPKYLTQVGVAPPRFVVFVGGGGGLPSSYRRYLENALREVFDFSGTPVVLRVRTGRRDRRG